MVMAWRVPAGVAAWVLGAGGPQLLGAAEPEPAIRVLLARADPDNVTDTEALVRWIETNESNPAFFARGLNNLAGLSISSRAGDAPRRTHAAVSDTMGLWKQMFGHR